MIEINDFEEPNPNNIHNYMLDTSAYNKIAENQEIFNAIKKSLKFGFKYYRTAIQEKELRGMGAKVYDENCVPTERYRITDEFKEKMKKFEIINLELGVKRASSIACGMRNHWILDGTYRLLEDNSKLSELCDEICMEKPSVRKKYPYAQMYDAMIAESAMHHNCYLISNDKKLRKTVNSKFSERAIDVFELIKRIQAYNKKDENINVNL